MKALFLMLAFVVGAQEAHALDVVLQWDANTETDLDHYTVYRATKTERTSGPWEKIAEVPKVSVNYIDTVPDQGNFTWYVTASDESGNESDPSNTVDLYDKEPPGRVKNLTRSQEEPP